MKNKDRYDSFANLKLAEKEGIDFVVECLSRESNILIMAPHGNYIEYGTSLIANSIAGNDYSLYTFDGLRAGRNFHDLHITSINFDEPRALELASKSFTIITIHGRRNEAGGNFDGKTVWVGGLDTMLADRIVDKFNAFEFYASHAHKTLSGKNERNICNRGRSGCGVQLEIPRDLRRNIAIDSDLLKKFAFCVRSAIDEHKNSKF